MKFDPRNALSIPLVYAWFQRLARGRCEEIYVTEHVRPKAGDRILDIGCGTGDVLRHMEGLEYVGFDVDRRMIDTANKRWGDRGVFLSKDLSGDRIDETGTFDLALAVGVLHHLNDSQAAKLFDLARQSLRSGGRLVTLDGCFVEAQSFLSRVILSLDRGKYVRSKEEYLRLAVLAFAQVEATVHHNMLRIPSSILVMECRR